MTVFVKTINGEGGQRLINLEIMRAEWLGMVLTEIFVIPSARPDARFGDEGAYLIFKPLGETGTNDAEKG